MTPIQAPSAALPVWVFVLAVAILATLVWFGVVRPLTRARAAGRAIEPSRPFTSSQIIVPLRLGAGLVLAFVLLAFLSNGGAMTFVDDPVHRFFVHHRSGFLSAVTIVFTNLGSPFGSATLLILAACFLARRTWSWTPPLILLVGPMLTGLVNTIIKRLVDRGRPDLADQLVVTTDPSFPSGHVAWSVSTWGCLAIALIWVFPQISRRVLIPVCIAVPLLVILTRLYLGVHYLSDVVAAATLAGAAVCFTLGLARRSSAGRSRTPEMVARATE